MSDQLVKEMGTFSFMFHNRYGLEGPRRYHELYLNDLETWLRGRGYETAREKSIMYGHRDRKGDAICSKRGLIDLYAKNMDHDVAVEFDNGKRLKFKSMEKLNNSNADILVGVVAGDADDRSVEYNNQRYGEMASNNSLVVRGIWLIVLSEGKIERLDTRRNAPCDLGHSKSTIADGRIRVGTVTGRKGYQQRAIEDY